MISFIVPAYNAEQCLTSTISALHRAGQALGKRYEVFVADDSSTDQTVAVQHGAVVVTATHRQIASTRNSGAQVARYEYLVFVDADTVVNAQVVCTAAQAMRSGAVGGGAGILFDEPTPMFAPIALRVIVRVFRALGLATPADFYSARTLHLTQSLALMKTTMPLNKL